MTDTERDLSEMLQEIIGDYPFIVYKVEKATSNFDQERFKVTFFYNEKLLNIAIYKENYRWFVNIHDDLYEAFHAQKSASFWKSLTLWLFSLKG